MSNFCSAIRRSSFPIFLIVIKIQVNHQKTVSMYYWNLYHILLDVNWIDLSTLTAAVVVNRLLDLLYYFWVWKSAVFIPESFSSMERKFPFHTMKLSSKISKNQPIPMKTGTNDRTRLYRGYIALRASSECCVEQDWKREESA